MAEYVFLSTEERRASGISSLAGLWTMILSSPNVRWLIQVPRLYDVYKATAPWTI